MPRSTSFASAARLEVALFATAAVLLSLAGGARACIDYEDYIHWVRTVHTPGSARELCISGSLAYVADNEAGLQIVDISDPQAPAIIGSVDTPNLCIDVAVSGSVAYLVDYSFGESRFHVIDASDPASPQTVGSLDTHSNASRVAVSGYFAFVAYDYSLAEGGLHVIDVSNPTNPQIVGNVATPGAVFDVGVSGALAIVGYVTSVSPAEGGLQLVDVSNPTYPQIVGSTEVQGGGRGIAVSADHAYVATWASGLQVVDLGNPAIPLIVGSVVSPGYDGAVFISGTYAYTVGGEFNVYDITIPANPELMGSVDTGDSYEQGKSHAVAVLGGVAYVADGPSGLQVVDVTCPRSSPILAGVDTPGFANGAAVAGTHVYVADGGAGLGVIDISNPTSPHIAGTLNTPGWAYNVATLGNHAYVADGSGGLAIIDVSDPQKPQALEPVSTPGAARDVAIASGYSYVAAGGSGLQILDVTNPDNPEVLGSTNTPDLALGVAVSDGFAYVADHWSGLQVIDVSNPTLPQIVGGLDALNYYAAVDLVVSGNYAYIGVTYSPPDHASPRSPSELECLDPTVVSAGFDFASRLDEGTPSGLLGPSGFYVVDVANASNPQIAGVIDLSAFENSYGGGELGVAVSGNYAYVAHELSGVHIIDISDPASPRVVGSVNTPGSPRAVAIDDVHAFVADNGGGLQVLPAQCTFDGVDAPEAVPGTTGIVSAWPNPFRGDVTMRFAFPSQGYVSLRIHDIHGRHVRSLTTGPALPGTARTVTWDGRDDRGRSVASGGYFVRLQYPEGIAVSRVMRIR